MATIHLVRHGQTNWNLEKRVQGQTDSVLTELGIQQAQEAGEKLKAVPFKHAYASSSVRARDTAQHILAHHDVPLELRDDLREIHLGPWEGALHEEIKTRDPERHGHFWQDPSQFQLEGGETFTDVRERALLAVQEMARKHPGEDVLLVSHGVWIKSLLTLLEGRHLRDFWLPPVMLNCSHSIVLHDQSNQWEPGNFQIQQYANMKEW